MIRIEEVKAVELEYKPRLSVYPKIDFKHIKGGTDAPDIIVLTTNIKKNFLFTKTIQETVIEGEGENQKEIYKDVVTEYNDSYLYPVSKNLNFEDINDLIIELNQFKSEVLETPFDIHDMIADENNTTLVFKIIDDNS